MTLDTVTATPVREVLSPTSHAIIQSTNPAHPIAGQWLLEGGTLTLEKLRLPQDSVAYPNTDRLTSSANLISQSTTPLSIGLILGLPDSVPTETPTYTTSTDITPQTGWAQKGGGACVVGLRFSPLADSLVFDDTVQQGETYLAGVAPTFPSAERWWFNDSPLSPSHAVLLIQVNDQTEWQSFVKTITGQVSDSLMVAPVGLGEVLTPHAPNAPGFAAPSHKIQSYILEGQTFVVSQGTKTPPIVAKENPSLPQMTMINSLAPLDAALQYARMGWPVLRVWPVIDGRCSCPTNCSNAGKHPMGGTRASTTDESEIRRWWKQTPAAGVALATGVAFNALDVDVGEDRNGFSSLITDVGLTQEQLTSLGVIRQSTPSGGTHFLFAKDPTGLIQFKNFTRKGSHGGLDMRSTNGIIVCAPTVGVTGVPYQWVHGDLGVLWPMPQALESSCISWSATVASSSRDKSKSVPNWDTPEVEAQVDMVRVAEVLGTKYQFLLDGVAEDRSAAIFGVCVRLFRSRFTPEQVMWILCHSACYAVAANHRKSGPDTWLWEYCVQKSMVEAPPTPDDMFRPVKEGRSALKKGAVVLDYVLDHSAGELGQIETHKPGGSVSEDGEVTRSTKSSMLIHHPEEAIALIRWEDRDLPMWCDKVESALSMPLQPPLTEPPIFRRANGLCVVGMSAPTSVEDIKRNSPVLSVGDIKQVGVIDLLTRYFRWETPVNANGAGGVRSIHCPRILATALLERAKTATSCKFPPLVAVTSCPTIRPDATIISQNGYDESTGLFLWSDIDFTDDSLPSKITEQDVISALSTLNEPYEGFPFASKSDWATAICHVLTGVVRPMLHSAPMFVYTAPTMGSGKTLAATVASYIFSGSSPSLSSWSRNIEEQSKVLFALLLGGETSVLIDNLNGELVSEPLCTILTENSYSGRRLGLSEHVEVPTTCTWAVSGNNIVVRGDLTTRALVCRIDAKLEKPEERSFDRNLHEWVPDNRTRLVRAALIIIKGYLDAGSPVKGELPTWGRFENWSDWVREPLFWATRLSGIENDDGEIGVDVYASTSSLHDADPEREERVALLTNLHRLFGAGKTFTVAGLSRLFKEPVNPLFVEPVPGSPATQQQITSRSEIEALPFELEAEKQYRDKLMGAWDRMSSVEWLHDWAVDLDPRSGTNFSNKTVSTALSQSCDIPANGLSLRYKGIGGAGSRKQFILEETEN